MGIGRSEGDTLMARHPDPDRGVIDSCIERFFHQGLSDGEIAVAVSEAMGRDITQAAVAMRLHYLGLSRRAPWGGDGKYDLAVVELLQEKPDIGPTEAAARVTEIMGLPKPINPGTMHRVLTRIRQGRVLTGRVERKRKRAYIPPDATPVSDPDEWRGLKPKLTARASMGMGNKVAPVPGHLWVEI